MNYKKYHRDKTYLENESHFRNIFSTRFKIAKHFGKKGRVLDIGASTGIMLSIFKNDGWETWGVEPSESANAAKEGGHRIIKNYFEKAKLPKNFFDVVIMNHTLEHLDDPVLVLRRIYTLLKKEGILLVDVPNAGGLGSRLLGDKWPYRLPLEHKHQFTKVTLSKVFRDAGFEVVHFKSRSGVFEFGNPVLEIWESMIGMKKRFFTNLINIPYDILVTILNYGDSMTMVGKK